MAHERQKRPYGGGQVMNHRPNKAHKANHDSKPSSQNPPHRNSISSTTSAPHKKRPQSQPHPTSADLDRIHPSKAPYATIPAYPPGAPRTITLPSAIYPPPLPPLAPHLATGPFTHTSVSDDRAGKPNYERLEFLGDAYLEVIATRLIYARFPALPVGRQSTLRETLVRNSTLAGFARLYGFEKRVIKGREEWSAERWEKVLGDTVEAYVAAIVLSEGVVEQESEEEGMKKVKGGAVTVGGFSAAESWITALWVPALLRNDPNTAVVVNRKDELARTVGGKFVTISYREEVPMTLSADRSTQQYTVGVFLTGWGHENVRLAVGKGINVKEAGMRAAGFFLDQGGRLLEELREKKRLHDEERRDKMSKEMEQKEVSTGNDREGAKGIANGTC